MSKVTIYTFAPVVQNPLELLRFEETPEGGTFVYNPKLLADFGLVVYNPQTGMVASPDMDLWLASIVVRQETRDIGGLPTKVMSTYYSAGSDTYIYLAQHPSFTEQKDIARCEEEMSYLNSVITNKVAYSN